MATPVVFFDVIGSERKFKLELGDFSVPMDGAWFNKHQAAQTSFGIRCRRWLSWFWGEPFLREAPFENSSFNGGFSWKPRLLRMSMTMAGRLLQAESTWIQNGTIIRLDSIFQTVLHKKIRYWTIITVRQVQWKSRVLCNGNGLMVEFIQENCREGTLFCLFAHFINGNQNCSTDRTAINGVFLLVKLVTWTSIYCRWE